MSSFIDMGGYAGYVWPAYGVAMVVMVGLLVASLLGSRARERELKVLQELRPHRTRRGGDAAKAGEAAQVGEETTRADA